MSVRAIQTRIECDRTMLEHLWRTHCVYNGRLQILLKILFSMRRGELGSTKEHKTIFQKVASFILARDAKDAVDLLNAVSIKKRSAASAFQKKATIPLDNGETLELTGQEVFEPVLELTSKGIFAYEKEMMRDGLPDSLFQPLTRDAVSVISSYNALVELWKKEHEQWLKDKTAWESDSDHAKYLALRPKFDAFENSVGGKVGKRRGRWHLYIEWLRENPDLAAWRGQLPRVYPLSPEAKNRISKAKPWKTRTVEAEEFWSVNPELQALDRLHGEYEKKFVRRRKNKRNPDGFDHRPTFTMPHPLLHPRWTLFNAPQTSPSGYKNLCLPQKPADRGSLDLHLLTGEKDNGIWPSQWISLYFRADPRLSQLRPAQATKTIRRGKNKGQTKTRQGYEYLDPYLHISRPAKISGVKLIFQDIRLNDDGSLKSAMPYLVFTCTINDLPLTEAAQKIEWSDTGQITKTGKPRKSRKLPDR